VPGRRVVAVNADARRELTFVTLTFAIAHRFLIVPGVMLCCTGISKLAFFMSCLQSQHALGRLPGPAPGSTYSKTLSMPIAGKQTVTLRIASSNAARLQMSGYIDMDEPIWYTRCPLTGQFSFELSPNTIALVSKYRTTLKRAGYVDNRDVSFVDIKIMALPEMHIELQRDPSSERKSSGTVHQYKYCDDGASKSL